ncbi:MAG: NUDIX hydrolase [Candidatus Saccharimonadales bacterium]
MINGLQKIGTIVFWAAWPFWFVYFKVNHRRSRVLVIADGKVLLLKGWLSSGKWGLPGGGAARAETPAAAAVRELHEEAGILAAGPALCPLGRRRHSQAGLGYTASYFLLELQAVPALHLRWYEIASAAWVPLGETKQLQLGQDVQYALKKYRLLTQPTLL